MFVGWGLLIIVFKNLKLPSFTIYTVIVCFAEVTIKQLKDKIKEYEEKLETTAEVSSMI